MSQKQPTAPDPRPKPSEALQLFMATGWAPRPQPPAQVEVAAYAARRRARLSKEYPGACLVVPAGGLKVRSNDCDHPFRPHSAFAHLTGLGADREPDAVLVLDPTAGAGHAATLFLRPRADRDSEEFYLSARYGEFWVGQRPSLADVEHELGLACRHIDELPDALANDLGDVDVKVVRDADPDVTTMVDNLRAPGRDVEATEAGPGGDLDLARFLAELRLVKDEYEIEQLRTACGATAEGFEHVVRELATAVERGRGERWVEGAFGMVARHRGNGVGYASIAAAGAHACTLHWIRNDGDVRDGELLLLDAGVEVNSLYTADVTRTLPVSGRFTAVQRDIYDAVLAAQQAGFEAVRPGNKHRDIHAATSRVIASKLADLGLLSVSVDESLSPDGHQHRRWMVHGTSHHLGLDVHDCAQARKQCYADGELRPGMVLTVEPGLYFKADDLTVPAELRGIGIRIEDDLLVTDDGYEVLSNGVPRQPDELEAWMADLR